MGGPSSLEERYSRAKRLKEGTQLEVLQLPLDDDQRPAGQRTGSQGRLLAWTRSFWIPRLSPMGHR